jgi:hypothetical protein
MAYLRVHRAARDALGNRDRVTRSEQTNECRRRVVKRHERAEGVEQDDTVTLIERVCHRHDDRSPTTRFSGGNRAV